LALLSGGVAIPLACTTFRSNDPLPAEGNDAAPLPTGSPGPDADVVSGATGPSADAATCQNLLLNGGFEDKSSCDPWSTGISGTLVISGLAHWGTSACMVCVDHPTDVGTTTALFLRDAAPGEHVRFSAWVRAADARLFADNANAQIDSHVSPNIVNLSETYQQISADMVPDAALGGRVVLALQAVASDKTGGCYLFDDVVACRGDGGVP
jgi:hypothetical protein